MVQRAPPARVLTGLLAVFVALGVLTTSTALLSAPVTSGTQLPLSTAEALAAAGRLQSATLHDADHHITGTYLTPHATPQAFWSAYPAADAMLPGLVSRLTAGGTTVNVDSQEGKATAGFLAGFLLPALLVLDAAAIAVLALTSTRVTRPRLPRARGARDADARFDDVEGAPEAVAVLREVARGLAAGSGAPVRLLVAGPPGCGKTLLVRALAAEAGARVAPAAGGIPSGRWPCVLLAAHVDSLSPTQSERLLELLDSLPPGRPLAVAATALRLENVPPLLAGRFEQVVTVRLPAPAARAAILRRAVRRLALDGHIDVEGIARDATGLSGADLAGVAAQAGLIAQAAGRLRVSQLDLEDALKRIASDGWDGKVMAADERRRAAVHQAGHAVVAAALGRGRRLRSVCILDHAVDAVPAPPFRGEATHVRSRSEVLADLTILCAGTAAEELYFEEPSTRGESDVARAIDIASGMAWGYALSVQGTGGPDHVATEAEVRRLLDDAAAAATERLRRCHDPLVDLVLQLERDEVVQGVALSDLLIRALELEIAGITEAGEELAEPMLRVER